LKEIRTILKAYDTFFEEGMSMALASVVNIEESSYRRIGARMLVSSDGRWVGGISGGCLEGDALKQAKKAIFNNTASIVTYDTLEDDDQNIGVGLGCNGKIEVLFTPLPNKASPALIENLKLVSKKNTSSILLKVIDVKGSSDIKLGAEIVIDERDEIVHFCELDNESLKLEIEKTRIKRRPQIISLVNNENATVRLLVEYIRPETKLIIVGDNYDVLSMMNIANEMGWEIHLIGLKRKFSANMYNLAEAVYDYSEWQKLPNDEFTVCVMMTHDLAKDVMMLPFMVQMNLPYIGMLGPKKRRAKIDEMIPELDLSSMDHFHAPVGLDIGAETPEEIALSVAAEIIAVLRHREGASLKFRQQTIHDRTI